MAAFRIEVLVRLKAGILDPQGLQVERRLGELGFLVSGARIGRLVELTVDAETETDAKALGRAMADRLLVNPVLETCEIRVAEA